MNDNKQDNNVEYGEEEDETDCNKDEAFWSVINIRSARRLNSTQSNKSKMKKIGLQYNNGFKNIQSMNNELHEYLQRLYGNETESSSNIILCVGITFLCKRFFDLFAQVEDDIEAKYEGRALKASEVNQWLLDLSNSFTKSKNPVLKKHSLKIFVIRDYESFGYRHNDGYMFVDISNPDTSELNVYSFRKACSKEKDNNLWIMLNSKQQFVSVVKDHEFGMFLYQVCQKKLIASISQLPI